MRFLIVLALFSTISFAQVGIGTTNPDESSILHLESDSQGFLLPRVSTTQRDAIANPANGLMIFNIDTNNVEINVSNNISPIWAEFVLYPSTKSVKYSNIDITTNINAIGTVPIFGNLEWNDDTTLFEYVNTNTLKIKETGRYEIRVNIALEALSTNAYRAAPEIAMAINGSFTGAIGSTGYIRDLGGHNKSSLHLIETFNLDANDELSVLCSNATSSSAIITMRLVGASNIYIKKIE